MSSAVQVKLLTLLNVSAIKRPLNHDRPGGWRSSSIDSANAAQIKTNANGVSASEAESAEDEDGSGEPPKKKRRGVSFGGEMGPTGSANKKADKKDKGGEVKAKKAVAKEKVTNVTKQTVTAPKTAQEETKLSVAMEVESDDEESVTGVKNAEAGPSSDPFNTHFSVSPPQLTAEARAIADSADWTKEKKMYKGLGRAIRYEAGGKGKEKESGGQKVVPRITPAVLERFNDLHPSPAPVLSSTLDIISSYTDLYLSNLDSDGDGTGLGGFGPETEAARSAATMHGLNHVLKTRKRIIRNNEKLAHAQDKGEDVSGIESRDQSFVRPKMLILVPFRSLALHYLENHLFPLAPAGTQIENHKPFLASFGVPEGVEDPLSLASAKTTYPADHIATFSGNSDDNFRFGIKITRKAWRVILPPAGEDKLVGCDILVASPLGLRMAADKEEGTDVLSSLEVVVADGLDVMAMQNWEHVQYAFSNMNKIPNKPHGCDFSRVKPFYLDSLSRYVRQTILISRYDTPEIRSLFNRSLVNVAGKVRLDRADYDGVLGEVRKGVKQVFERVEVGRGGDAVMELEARFKFFTEQTLPALLKSAVSKTNTLIMVPSYFDFVRVVNYLRKMDKVSFAAISEYSSNQEISRARTGFFKGKKAFLVVTERFHFYRRYRIRGAKTIVFYSLPDHASFYSELFSFPFLQDSRTTGKQTVEIDEGEVSCRVAYSRWDAMKLGRVVGVEGAKRMVTGEEARFTFI